MQIELSHIIAIAALTVSILGQLAQRFLTISQMQMRISILETRMGLIWNLIETRLSAMLKMPTHHELDRLLDKLAQQSLTREESERLYRLLDVRKREIAREDPKSPLLIIADATQKAIESLWIEMDQPQPPSWWQRVKGWWR